MHYLAHVFHDYNLAFILLLFPSPTPKRLCHHTTCLKVYLKVFTLGFIGSTGLL